MCESECKCERKWTPSVRVCGFVPFGEDSGRSDVSIFLPFIAKVGARKLWFFII